MNCIRCGSKMIEVIASYAQAHNTLYIEKQYRTETVYVIYNLHLNNIYFDICKKRVCKPNYTIRHITVRKNMFRCINCNYEQLRNVPNKNKKINFNSKPKFGPPQR